MTDRFESLNNEIRELEQRYGQDWDKQVRQSAQRTVNISKDRCIELARKPELGLGHWRELTGISHGMVGRFFVTSGGVSFVKWGNEFKRSIPDDGDFDAIDLDDKQSPLLFPCTPAELLHFIDTARHDLYGFCVPDAFRQAVTDTPPQVPDEAQDMQEQKPDASPAVCEEAPAQTDTAPSGAIENAAPKGTPAGISKREVLAVDWPLHGKFDQGSLSYALSDVPDWLKPARTERGSPGKASSLWNPAKLADCLVSKRYANQKAIGQFLGRHFAEWLPEWDKLQEYR